MRNLFWLPALLVCSAVVANEVGPWPTVRPTTASFDVDFSAERIVIDLPIFSDSGQPLYYFACRGGQTAYLDKLPENWVGPLMCTLTTGTEPSETSLLSEDDSAAWYSRGQFSAEQLTGTCAQYPEYGAHRTFRLRAMTLTLDAQHITLSKGRLAEKFQLQVSVQQDPSAQFFQAQQPGFLRPEPSTTANNGEDVLDCQTVRKGNTTRMCRDWENNGGSWGICAQ